MPDFGLTEALEAALKASKGTEVMRPGEQALAAQAAKTAPAAAAPAVPAAATPSVRSAPATPAPGATQAPPVNLGQPPADIPPPAAQDAAALPSAAPAPPGAATGTGDATPPTGAVAATEPVPVSPQPAPVPGAVAAANRLPAPASPLEAVARPVAQRFVTANIGDFPVDKLNMTHMPNVDVMRAPDGMKAAILQVADDNEGAIQAARGGTVADEQIRGIAQDLSVNADVVKQAVTREFGSPVKRPAIALAARMVEQHQLGTLLDLSDRVANGTASSEELIQFEQYRQLVTEGRIQLAGVGAESGRLQRVLGMPVGLPPEVVDHIAGVLKQNNPNQQAMAAAIKLAGSPTGIANIVQGSSLLGRIGTATRSMWQRVFINGILSGPPTWKTIILGNNLNLGLNNFDLYAAGIGRGLYGLAARAGGFPTAEEGVTLADAYAHMHGVISGGADALRVAGRVMKTGQSLDNVMRFDPAEAGGTRNVNPALGTTQSILPEIQNSYFGSIARVVDNIVDAPGSRVISSIDEFTKTLGYRGYATMMALKEVRARLEAGTLRPGDAEQAMLEAMNNMSPEMQQAAEDWAHRMTFQSPFPQGSFLEGFSSLINSKAPVLRFIFPFVRTATNIFKQSLLERTPMAMFAARQRALLAQGGFEGDLAKARLATGTAVIGMVAWMAIHDRITGDPPKDPKERAIWQMDGRTPYSIRVTDPLTGKDSWRDISKWEPMATVAGATADVVRLMSYIHADEDVDSMMPHAQMLDDAAAHIAASVIQNTGNKTFMQGAAQFSEMYNDPQRAFSMWSEQMLANMVPYSGALKFARNMQDPFMRQAFTLIDKVKDELPTFYGVRGSKTLPARLDVFGEPRVHSGGNSILGPLNPLPGSSDKKDAVSDEIQALMETTRTVPITPPSKLLSFGANGKGLQDGQGMRLTPQEYNDYVLKSRSDPIFGGVRNFREELARVIALPIYQQATPAVRANMIQGVQHDADRIGAQRLYRDNTDFRERMTAWQAEVNRLKFNR